MGLRGLLRTIQQRKLDRVAAAYGVVAWVIVQAASIALPAFGAPTWVLKVLIAAAFVGFPIALLVAWHVTPHPHRKRVAAAASPTVTDITLLALLGIVVLLSLAQFAFEMGYLPGISGASAPSPTGISSASLSPPAATPTEASIAVLPFLNMSGDPKKEYFSDGISEELLNHLSNAPNLRVAARTSSFAFKGKSEDIRKIARALNVRAVLEGSVREEGQHIRITAQLINAADGYHLWSETYDRDLSNILQVQDEIAQAITAALTHRLLGGNTWSAASHAAIDPEAYRKYLEGQSFSALKTDEGDARAIELLTEATKLQPDFASAFAALGRTYIHSAQFHSDRADLVSAAQQALDEALRLDPKNLEALSSRLALQLMNWNWHAALEDAGRLQSINPHSIFAVRGLHYIYGSFGFPKHKIAATLEATRLDPFSFVDLNNLATVYNARGEYRQAASAASAALALRPGRPLALYQLCWAHAGAGQFDEAQQIIRRLSAMNEAGASNACAVMLAARAGRIEEARKHADTVAGMFPVFIFNETDIGMLYFSAGDYSKAMRWFEHAYEKRNDDLFAVSYFEATPPALAKLPAWKALMRRPEAKVWKAERDRLAGRLSGG